MAVLRLTALALVVGCGTAGAEPAATTNGAPTTNGALRAGMPATWKALPAIASAASTAARADGVAIDAAEAWGDPAGGCYAVHVVLHGGSDGADALAEQVLASFGATPKLVLRNAVKPTGPQGALTASFEAAPHRGRVRVELGNGRVDTLACFGNARDLPACDATCTRVLGAP